VHELSIARAIVDTASRHAGDRRVRTVRLRVGALRQIVPDAVPFYFGIASKDTVCDGAGIELEAVQARLRCQACGKEWDPAPAPAEDVDDLVPTPRFRCPSCGSGGGEVIAGDELEVESIDVDGREGVGGMTGMQAP
jgi:hydrogenase nickel incorporation protein HypA/HybF